MARPKNTIPSKEYKVCMPADLAAPMELMLFSELEGRIPYGKLSEYINNLVREDLKQRGIGNGN